MKVFLLSILNSAATAEHPGDPGPEIEHGPGPHGMPPGMHGMPPGMHLIQGPEFEIHFSPLPLGPGPDSARAGKGGMISIPEILSIFPSIGDHSDESGGEDVPITMVLANSDHGKPPVALFGGDAPKPMHVQIPGKDGKDHVHTPISLKHEMDKSLDMLMGSIMDDITSGFTKSILPALKKLDQEQNGRPCHNDLQKHCKDSPRKLHCLGQHREDISPQCRAKIKRSISFACSAEISQHCDTMEEGVLHCLERLLGGAHGPHGMSEACMDSVLATRTVAKTFNTHTAVVVHKPTGQAVHVHHPFNEWFQCSKLGEKCECANGFVRYGMPGRFSPVVRVREHVHCAPSNFHEENGEDHNAAALVHGGSCQCMLERFPTSNLWNLCGGEGELCKCVGAVRYGDGISWSQPIHSAKLTPCVHHIFHFHPKTYQKAQHHCQCLPSHGLKAADAQSHPHDHRARQPSWVHAILAITVLLFLAALVTGKLSFGNTTKNMLQLQKSDLYGNGYGTELEQCYRYGSSL